VKIDVQGFEDRVIRGGTEAIRHAQWLLLELSVVPLYDHAPSFDELYRLVSSVGFSFAGFTDQLEGRTGEPLQVDAIFRKTSA